jgi:hypothetical protein
LYEKLTAEAPLLPLLLWLLLPKSKRATSGAIGWPIQLSLASSGEQLGGAP